MDVDKKTAVTVIGGYLGAGKTTLVNYVLRTADSRVAVLVNDFGDVNIDAELIASQDGDTMELANGCICCSLVDGLAAAMNTISELEQQPERLVIEASGVADPASVAAYGHGPGFFLDAVVVVVDGETVRTRAGDKYVGDTVRSQIAAGHIMVVNKLDLLDDDAAENVTAWVTEQNPDALVVGAVNGEVSPEILFGRPPHESPAQRSGAHEHHGRHDHDVFDSWTWEGSSPLSRAQIEAVMTALPDSVMRAKGILMVDDRPDKLMLLQRVGRRWNLLLHGPLPDGAVSQLVLIGLTGAIDDNWLTEHLGTG
ncbi:MAG: GTP-binding protein [Actinomycetota bacterium]